MSPVSQGAQNTQAPSFCVCLPEARAYTNQFTPFPSGASSKGLPDPPKSPLLSCRLSLHCRGGLAYPRPTQMVLICKSLLFQEALSDLSP